MLYGADFRVKRGVMAVHLVLGGARSGKSAYAQRAAETVAVATGRKPVLIATAEALDGEMAARIAEHRRARGPQWATIEAPIALPQAIKDMPPGSCAVVDCLTLWMSNLMMRDAALDAAVDDLVTAAVMTTGELWLVSNEVGLGLVPETPLGRAFRDAAGRLHQRLAAAADEVVLLIAGLPLTVKARR